MYAHIEHTNMKTLFIGFTLKHKGFLFMALFFAPFWDWLSDLLQWHYMPVRLLAMITFMVLIDFATGLAASYKNNITITSKKGLQSVWKLISYTVFLYVVVQVQHIGLVENTSLLSGLTEYIKLSVFTLAILWEMHSWGENLKSLYGTKPRLFTFMDVIAKAFEFLLIKKVKEATEMEDDKKE